MQEHNRKNPNFEYNKLERLIFEPSSDRLILNKSGNEQVHQKIEDIQRLLRRLLNIPSDYRVLIFDNRGLENNNVFALLNFSNDLRAGFLDTGSRSSAAIIAARKYFNVEIIGSSRESAYSYVPGCDWIPHNISFLHLTSTNELQGNQISKFPKLALPLICDYSADLFCSKVAFKNLDLIYAHGGCFIMPENLTTIFIRDSLLQTGPLALFNNPFLVNKIQDGIVPRFKDLFVLKHSLTELEANGGVVENVRHLSRFSNTFYREIDRNKKFFAIVNSKDRSMKAIRFFVTNVEDEFRFILMLDKNDINIVKRSPHGDFLISLLECKEEEIFQLVNVIQEFEKSPKSEIN
ncbi:hypothetical protein [Pedobacter mucosus]|uniref:hypothetical protein n=1 Tax=Pedobacter mucosus TaxID=2895286 RepID=UPI001EE49C76|nr:hypothetical protein [Pedobacter mucosus]UKT65088.1 hypothetical protein LOK61_04750 [Pedobacter mucosus]